MALTVDSRSVRPGSVYLAVRGSLADGHRFVPEAAQRGAVFGPHPRSYEQRLPRKMKRLALRGALTAKLADQQLKVIDTFGHFVVGGSLIVGLIVFLSMITPSSVASVTFPTQREWSHVGEVAAHIAAAQAGGIEDAWGDFPAIVPMLPTSRSADTTRRLRGCSGTARVGCERSDEQSYVLSLRPRYFQSCGAPFGETSAETQL